MTSWCATARTTSQVGSYNRCVGRHVVSAPPGRHHVTSDPSCPGRRIEVSRVYAKGLINQEPIAPAAGLKEGPVPAWSTQHRIAANRTLSALPAKAYGGILDCDEESRA